MSQTYFAGRLGSLLIIAGLLAMAGCDRLNGPNSGCSACRVDPSYGFVTVSTGADEALESINSSASQMPAHTNSLGMAFSIIPAGEFEMGLERGELSVPGCEVEQPRHRVAVTRPFWMGRHEVTVGQFRHFVAETGYRTEAEQTGKGCNGLNVETGAVEQRPEWIWSAPGFAQSDKHPVVGVSWQDAQEFCTWLSRKEDRTYRLPTEAEWEYSCRAGTWTTFFAGMNVERLEGIANAGDASLKRVFRSAGGTSSWNDGYAFTAPVGTFAPNAWSLFDMHGNVGEWCQDWYDAEYYARSPATDPEGPSSPTSWHVVRGGSWFNTPVSCRSSGRHDGIETAASTTNGFRVVMNAEEANAKTAAADKRR